MIILFPLGEKYDLLPSTQQIARPWFCWRGMPSKSKGFGDIRRICRYVFVGDWGEICFRLTWCGKENERFGKKNVRNNCVKFIKSTLQ